VPLPIVGEITSVTILPPMRQFASLPAAAGEPAGHYDRSSSFVAVHVPVVSRPQSSPYSPVRSEIQIDNELRKSLSQ